MESPLYESAGPDLKVIETLRHDGAGRFVRLDLHLARAARTCAQLRYPFDAGAVRAALTGAVGDGPARCRVTIDRAGDIAVETAPLPPAATLWRVSVAAQRLSSTDPWLAHKTTRRQVYDQARAEMPEGAQEVILLNEDALACDGSITNVFLPRGDLLLTPPLSCGLLPGVLRQSLLDSGAAEEARLTLDDLTSADRFFVGNSLRGLIAAKIL